jgi:hypothetical protein
MRRFILRACAGFALAIDVSSVQAESPLDARTAAYPKGVPCRT